MIIEQRVRKEIQKISGIDPFIRTRKREVVESRALYIHLLYKYYKKRPYHIAKVIGLNHATILHSLKNFDIYVSYNRELEKYLYEMLMNQGYDKIEMRKEYIRLKVDYLAEKDVIKLSDKVRDMYEESLIEQNRIEEKL